MTRRRQAVRTASGHGLGWEPPSPAKEPAPALSPSSTEPSPFALRVLAALEGDGIRPRGAAQLAEDLGAERREVERAFGGLADAGEAVGAKADVVFAAAVYEKLARAAPRS